jgi:hypothetical protein
LSWVAVDSTPTNSIKKRKLMLKTIYLIDIYAAAFHLPDCGGWAEPFRE